MALNENIKRLRKDRGWTQLELAEAAGTRVALISELEKGKGDPKLSTLEKLMQAFECSPDALLMDRRKASTNALLQQALERGLTLDEAHKRILIHNIDMYCTAAGIIHQTNSKQSLLRFLVPPHEPIYSDPPRPPDLEEEDA